jgi:hypothetical protein
MALRILLLVKEVMMVKQAMLENVKRLSRTINRFRERIASIESDILDMLLILSLFLKRAAIRPQIWNAE